MSGQFQLVQALSYFLKPTFSCAPWVLPMNGNLLLTSQEIVVMKSLSTKGAFNRE
jgi:hypothetical protein